RLPRGDDLAAARSFACPEGDVGAARLDREGHVVSFRQPHRGGAVGEEKFGIDDIERKIAPDFVEYWKQRPPHRQRTPPALNEGHGREERAIDLKSFPNFVAWLCAQPPMKGGKLA